MSAPGAFRAEDAALLERLEDEVILEALFRHHVGAGDASATAAPPARASGMIRLLRARPGGEEARASVLERRDARPLAGLFEAPTLAGLAPELLHHLALYYGRVADVVEATSPDASTGSRVRALGAWAALAEEGTYLRALAADIAGDALPDVEIERIARDAAIERVDELGRRAEEGARALDHGGRAAMRALARAKDACKLAGAKPETTSRLCRRAESRRAGAIEAALHPLSEQLAEASAQGRTRARAPDILGRAVPVWAWAEYDEAVEHFVVTHVTEVAWDIYRARDWTALASFLAPFQPLAESLTARVESDPSKIAWAAPCAQMLVFRSELEPTLERQITVARRALAVCPSHRNGRLVMASYLCSEAIRILESQPAFFLRGDDWRRAEAKVKEAERIYPASSSLAKAKAKLDATRRA